MKLIAKPSSRKFRVFAHFYIQAFFPECVRKGILRDAFCMFPTIVANIENYYQPMPYS